MSNIFDVAKQVLAEGVDREAFHSKAFDHHDHTAAIHQKQFAEMHRQMKLHLDIMGKALPNLPEADDMHFLRELHDAVQHHYAKAHEHVAQADYHRRAMALARPTQPKAKYV